MTGQPNTPLNPPILKMTSRILVSQSPPLASTALHRRRILPTTPRTSWSPQWPARWAVRADRSGGGPASAGINAVATAETPKKKRLPQSKGFVDEMRLVAMKLHTRDQAREGEKAPDSPPVAKWEPSVEGYLRFLVDSKLVYDTLEGIVWREDRPWYAVFRNTGLERADRLAKDLDWFKEQGYTMPEPSSPGISYARYLEELSEKDPPAFICHFYNVYFAHTAGGRMIGKKVAEKILDNRELEFYKWDGDLSQLLQNVKEKINIVANSWSREEKDHCLKETEKSFKYSGEILRLILS